MRKLNALLLLLLLFACKGPSTDDLSNVEVLNINMNGQTNENEVSSFIEKIEVIPLEINESALIHSFKKFSYCEELDVYIILDKNFILYVFSGDGKFIASSSSAYGDGPEQYVTIVDFNYNPYTKTIDLLDPYGTIYCYDLYFKLNQKKKLVKNDLVFMNLFPVEENKYLLAHSYVNEEDAVIYLADYTNGTIGDAFGYTGFLASVHMMREPFFKLNDGFYFSPRRLDYYFYHIDVKNETVNPVMKLDFGNNNIIKKDLIKQFGKPYSGDVKGDKVLKNVDLMKNINNFLVNSNTPLPIVKFLNDKYIYTHIIVNREPSNFIYNRITKDSFLQTGDFPISMPFFVEIKDNILFTLVDPYDIEKYINNYMSKETLDIISSLKEDDNPVIMKYYLKE